MNSERFARSDVRGFYVVFLGGEVYQWGAWDNGDPTMQAAK
jgi:hypothetical protein